jgi:ABC-type amino acid transport substrate-binding protein
MVILGTSGYFRSVTRHLALLVFWAWTFAVPAAAQNAPPTPPLVTVYFSERPPFSIVEGQTGILVNLAKVVLAEAGVRARFIELPSNRVLDLLQSEPSDALGIGYYKIPEREVWGRFSIPIYQESPEVALVNSRAAVGLGNPVRLDALLASGLTLGVKGGLSFGAVLDQKIRTQGLVPIETIADLPQLLKMVQSGRMDYTFLSQEEAEYLLRKDPSLAQGLVLTRLSEAPPGNQRYFLYPKSFDPALLDRIDAAIERVKASARYKDLVAIE